MQLLGRAPLHLDVDLVLRKVVWALWLPRLVELAPVGEVHLAAAAEALEVHGEVVVDLRDHLLERRLPLGLQAHHHVLPLLEVVARLAEPAAHLLDRARPPLEVAHRRGVGVGAVRLLLQRVDLALERRLVVRVGAPDRLGLCAALPVWPRLELRRLRACLLLHGVSLVGERVRLRLECVLLPLRLLRLPAELLVALLGRLERLRGHFHRDHRRRLGRLLRSELRDQLRHLRRLAQLLPHQLPQLALVLRLLGVHVERVHLALLVGQLLALDHQLGVQAADASLSEGKVLLALLRLRELLLRLAFARLQLAELLGVRFQRALRLLLGGLELRFLLRVDRVVEELALLLGDRAHRARILLAILRHLGSNRPGRHVQPEALNTLAAQERLYLLEMLRRRVGAEQHAVDRRHVLEATEHVVALIERHV
mmetsp:Transcript_12568/g.32914  ORF Transcript_12568/g.32914 Transcript_12568/m.32914 type:complete len:425 (-) Transcript_12568:843-2117(-)